MAAKPGIRAYSLFIRLLRVFLGAYLRLRFNMGAENRSLMYRLKPPYLVLPNHVGYWDPFMVSIFVPQAIHWVAADANFRSRIVRHFLGLVGAIPKAKAVTDFEAIRYILSVKEAGGVVGIFPEGQRTWDGTSLPLLYATAKLVRLMKSPVVTPIFLGGYFSHPRWSYKPRRGKLTVHFKQALTAEEARTLSTEEIHRRLSEALAHDDYEFQSKQMIPYKGKRIAEDLEHTLFVCPECKELGSLHSLQDHYRCLRCGFGVRYTERGFLELLGQDNESGEMPESPPFKTIRDWHRWQLEELPSLIDERRRNHKTTGVPILRDGEVTVFRGYRSTRLTKLGTADLELYPDRLSADFQQGRPLEIPLTSIRGLNVQLTRHLELYYEGQLYVFFPANRKVSAYKWQNAIEVLTKEQ